MLRGGSSAPQAPDVRDEVLGMLTTAPEPSPGVVGPALSAAGEQAGKMGRFFTEGLPQAARVAGEGLQQAATAPTLGTELRRRGTEGGFGERLAFGGLSPVPAAADLAERLMGMYGAVVRGAAELGPEKAKPLTEALLSQAPFIGRAGYGALGQDVRSVLGRPPRAAPVRPTNPLAGDVSGLLPPEAQPYRSGLPVPTEAPPLPAVRPPAAMAREAPPRITPTPPEALPGRVGAPPALGTGEEAIVPEFWHVQPSLKRAIEGQAPEIPALPGRVVGDQPRLYGRTRGPQALPGEVPLGETGEGGAMRVGSRADMAPEPVLDTPPAPPAPPRVTPPTPEPPPAPEAAQPPPRPPRVPRPGDVRGGANPEFQAERARWQERLAQIDYGTVNLRDTDEVRAFIKGVGGVRPGADYPDLPFFFKNRSGRPIDEIVQEIANAQGKPVKLVERQLTDTLMRYQSLREAKKAQRGSAPPPTATGKPPTMQAWEEQVRADPEGAYPDWLRSIVPPIPLPDLPEEEQDTTKGRLYRALQIVGLGAPAIGLAASRFRGRRPGPPSAAQPELPTAPTGPQIIREFPGSEGTSAVVTKHRDGYGVTVRDVEAGQNVGTSHIYPTLERAFARAREIVPPAAPPRFERTAMGDQALIPGAESRAMPSGAVASGRAQRPVEDLPLFGQEKAAQARKAEGAQRGLFDYLMEEQGAVFPRRGGGAPPPEMSSSRPPQVPPEFRSERVGGRSPVEPPPPTPPESPGAIAGARPDPEKLAQPGGLRTVQGWAREFYSPLISQWERMGLAGREVSRRVQETESQAQRWYGHHVDPIVRAAKKLSPTEAENFREVVEEGAQPLTQRVEALRRQYDRVFGPTGVIPEEAGRRNMIVMDREGEARMFQARRNFFPHEFSPEIVKEIRERGPAYDRAVKHLLDTGQAHDAETAGVMLAERFNFKRTTLGDRIFLMDPDRFVGGLERARDIDLPDYIRDPATAIAARGMKVSRRFSELDHYGRLDAEIGSPGGYIDPLTNEAVPAHGLLGRIQKERGREEAVHAASLFQQALGHQEYTPHLAGKQAVARAVTSFEAFTKLPMAAIANASQFAQVAARTNLTTAAKGLAGSVTRTGRDAARDLGVISDLSLRQLYEDMTGRQTLGGRAMRVALGPFNVVEKWDRIVGANAGLSWARTLEQRLAQLGEGRGREWMTRELERLNFAPDEIRQTLGARALTEEQRGRVAWAITDQTQFLGRRYRRSEFFNTPLGSVVGQFKTFAVNAGRMLKQNVLDEARHGNFAPLARVAVLFPLVGEGVQDVKAILRGSERPDHPLARALDNVMAVGGLGLTADLMQAVARRGNAGALAWLAGPAFTDASQAMERLYGLGSALSEGDEDKVGQRARSLGRLGMRQVPFVGPTLEQATREDPKGRQLQEMTVGERLKLP